jgi:hypothetical protein
MAVTLVVRFSVSAARAPGAQAAATAVARTSRRSGRNVVRAAI